MDAVRPWQYLRGMIQVDQGLVSTLEIRILLLMDSLHDSTRVLGYVAC